MEFLGVGPTELLFIVAIAIIVLGPKNMAETGRTIGNWLNRFVKSDAWKVIRNTSQEIQRLPTQWMREDNLQNFLDAATDQKTREKHDAWTGQIHRPSASLPADPAPAEANPNTIQPLVETPSEPLTPSLAPAPARKGAVKSRKPAPAKKSGKKPAVKSSRSPRKKSNA